MYLIRNEEEVRQLEELLEGVLNADQAAIDRAERPELLVYLFRRLGKKPVRLLKQLLIEEHGLAPTANPKEGLEPLLLILDERFKQSLPLPLQELGTHGLTEEAIQLLKIFVLCFYQLEWRTELGQEWLVLSLDEKHHIHCETDYTDLLCDYEQLLNLSNQEIVES